MLDKKTLKALYVEQGLTDREVALQEGVTEPTVGRWRKVHKIPTRGQRFRSRWSEKALRVAVKANLTMSGVLRELGLKVHGGNFKTVHRHIAHLGLSTAHWQGQAHGTGGNRTTRPLSEILVVGSDYANSSALKRRLLREGLLENWCSECELTPEWKGKPLSLHLDPRNGDNTDHRLENLRLLCPNCHSQTSTYAGRNKGKMVRGEGVEPPTARS